VYACLLNIEHILSGYLINNYRAGLVVDIDIDINQGVASVLRQVMLSRVMYDVVNWC